MQHNFLSINDKNKDFIVYSRYLSYGANEKERNKMKSIMLKAVENDLTHRQRECITMYYFNNMKMREIAAVLSLTTPTVSRHIHAGVKKLQNVARYY